MPTLYVLAGPNGAGKSTAFKALIPPEAENIDADLIAKSIKAKARGLNTQELANQEAAYIFNEKVTHKATFSIETNLFDLETYKSLQQVQEMGYQVHLYFMCVESPEICINRVAQRVEAGGHHVNKDIIKARYETGLKLLAYYKNFPDLLVLLDNSSGGLVRQAEIKKGEVVFKNQDTKTWVKAVLNAQKETSINPANLSSVDQVRKLYKSKKGRGLSF